MSFEGFAENSCGGGGGGGDEIVAAMGLGYTNNMPSGVIPQPRLVSSLLPNNNNNTNTNTNTNTSLIFNSPALSLALQTNAAAEAQARGGGGGMGAEELLEGVVGGSSAAVSGSGRRSREEMEQELNTSRSGGSDNFLDGSGSGDDLEAADDHRPARKKRYHRHTPQQIQELESLFKECPHPDEKQRLELSRRLCLETRQVKFWFQNRRTQMKTQMERHENSLLRQENDKLRAENLSIREAMRNPICTNCGGPAIIGDISLEEQHLRVENARLKDELDRVCALAGKFLGRPIPSMPPPSSAALSSGLELGLNGFEGLNTSTVTAATMPLGSDCAMSQVSRPMGMMNGGVGGLELERSMFLELALAAMEELLKMAQGKEPLWVLGDGGREVLNRDEYQRSAFTTPCDIGGLKFGAVTAGFASEASRETGVVIINSLALVETLMDSNRWAEMFPCMIARTSTTDVISSGMGGTRNGALQLMQAELQVLSPLVPVREVSFLRFCKQHAEGVWAVVDVSVDGVHQETSGAGGAPAYVNCKRLPSGCVVQDMPNGYSKVTWVEHAEYEESVVHHLYRPLIAAGMGFGAQRWIATLQRQCQCLAILMSSTLPSPDHSTAITAGGRRSMLKLAQRMTDNFCGGVCASRVHKWNKLSAGNVDEDVRVMTRKSIDDPGEPPGIVLSAATSVWLPVSPNRLFDFLRDERFRSQWDILSNGGPMQEMTHIAKGQDHGNCVSLLRATAMNPGQSSMLILQETCTDASGSLVVYAPVDVSAMQVVMNGGDSAYVALLPSGFAIVPDGPGSDGPPLSSPRVRSETGNGGPCPQSQHCSVSGSLLTVAFQILVNSLPTAKLTVESVETVNNLISCTVQKIKAALHCES